MEVTSNSSDLEEIVQRMRWCLLRRPWLNRFCTRIYTETTTSGIELRLEFHGPEACVFHAALRVPPAAHHLDDVFATFLHECEPAHVREYDRQREAEGTI